MKLISKSIIFVDQAPGLNVKIFVGGIRTETNTFVSRKTSGADFRAGDISPAITQNVDPGLHPGYVGIMRAATAARYHVARGIVAYAVPGGPVEQPVYEALKAELLEDLQRAMPVDMVMLDLHGAMVAEDTIDCEGDILEDVRRIVGFEVIVGALLDPHAVLTRRMLTAADLLHAYKEYPHTDVIERAEELFNVCSGIAEGGRRPVATIANCGLIGGFPTIAQPMAGFVDWMKEAEGRQGIHSVSLIQSFPWCDHPDAGAKLLVYADDPHAGYVIAKEGSDKFRALFEAAVIHALEPDEAARIARDNPGRRYLIADVSDNPGGGASGDATHVLRALVDHGVDGIGLGILYDPESLEAAWQLGVGAEASFALGGKQSSFSGAPIVVTGRIAALADDDGVGARGAVGGPSSGPLALIETDFGSVILGRERRQALSPSFFTAVGADPRKFRCIILKSSAHFRAAFADFDNTILEVGSPTAMNTNLTELPFKCIRRPLWPFDPLPPLKIWAVDAEDKASGC
jgi:microcystin degradation protein MlrC